MGMTIDKSIEKLKHEKQCFIDELWENTGEVEAYDLAIETMRKYQKIQKIANDKNINGDYLKVLEIRMVLEDGNDN